MNVKTKKLVVASVFAVLVCVATLLVTIPSPLKGYINLGDCMVLLAGFTLSPLYGFLSAGLGSALADLFAGYVIYAPATFLIKGMMALLVYAAVKILSRKIGCFASRILSGFFAEVLMILGYLVFEGFLYGFMASAVNIPANAVQGLFGLVVGVMLKNILDKIKVKFD